MRTLKKILLLYVLSAVLMQIVMLYHWVSNMFGFNLGVTAAIGLAFGMLFVVAWIIKKLKLDFDIPIFFFKS